MTKNEEDLTRAVVAVLQENDDPQDAVDALTQNILGAVAGLCEYQKMARWISELIADQMSQHVHAIYHGENSENLQHYN